MIYAWRTRSAQRRSSPPLLVRAESSSVRYELLGNAGGRALLPPMVPRTDACRGISHSLSGVISSNERLGSGSFPFSYLSSSVFSLCIFLHGLARSIKLVIIWKILSDLSQQDKCRARSCCKSDLMVTFSKINWKLTWMCLLHSHRRAWKTQQKDEKLCYFNPIYHCRTSKCRIW